MTLLNDVSRCTGGNGTTEICPERDTCQRYTERMTGDQWRTPTHNYYKGNRLWACDDKLPVVANA